MPIARLGAGGTNSKRSNLHAPNTGASFAGLRNGLGRAGVTKMFSLVGRGGGLHKPIVVFQNQVGGIGRGPLRNWGAPRKLIPDAPAPSILDETPTPSPTLPPTPPHLHDINNDGVHDQEEAGFYNELLLWAHKFVKQNSHLTSHDGDSLAHQLLHHHINQKSNHVVSAHLLTAGGTFHNIHPDDHPAACQDQDECMTEYRILKEDITGHHLINANESLDLAKCKTDTVSYGPYKLIMTIHHSKYDEHLHDINNDGVHDQEEAGFYNELLLWAHKFVKQNSHLTSHDGDSLAHQLLHHHINQKSNHVVSAHLLTAGGTFHNIHPDDHPAACQDQDECMTEYRILKEDITGHHLINANESLDLAKCKTDTVSYGPYKLIMTIHHSKYDELVHDDAGIVHDINSDGVQDLEEAGFYNELLLWAHKFVKQNSHLTSHDGDSLAHQLLHHHINHKSPQVASYHLLTAGGTFHNIHRDDPPAACHDQNECMSKDIIFKEDITGHHLINANESLDLAKCKTDTVSYGQYELKMTIHHNKYDDIIKHIDTNKDGVVSFEEFSDYYHKKQPDSTSDEVREIFNGLDTNNDGVLDSDDVAVHDLDNNGLLDSVELEWTIKKVGVVENLTNLAMEHFKSMADCVCEWITAELTKNITMHLNAKISQPGDYQILYNINDGESTHVTNLCDNDCYNEASIHTDMSTKQLISKPGMLHIDSTSLVTKCFTDTLSDRSVHFFLSNILHTFNSFKAELEDSGSKIGQFGVLALLDTLQKYEGYSTADKYVLVVSLPPTSEQCPPSPIMYLAHHLFKINCSNTSCLTSYACTPIEGIDLHTGYTIAQAKDKCMIDFMDGKTLQTYTRVENVQVVTFVDTVDLEWVNKKGGVVENLTNLAMEHFKAKTDCVCEWINAEITKNITTHLNTKISQPGDYQILYNINNGESNHVTNRCENDCYNEATILTDMPTKQLLSKPGMLHIDSTSLVTNCFTDTLTDRSVHFFLSNILHTFNSFKAELEDPDSIIGQFGVHALLDTLQKYEGYSTADKYVLVVSLPSTSDNCPPNPNMQLDHHLFKMNCGNASCLTSSACAQHEGIDLQTGHTTAPDYKCFIQLMEGKTLHTYTKVENVHVVTLNDASSTESY